MKIVVESWDRRFDRLKPVIKKSARKLANFLKKKNFHWEIYLVGEGVMNKNVLAFPAPKRFPHPDIKGHTLGEVFLNPEYIKKHGEDLLFMLIHGFLHLLGYNHDKKSDRIIMQKKEQQLMEILKGIHYA